MRGPSSSLLRGAGLRATVSRLAVLDLLTERTQPQSHADCGELQALPDGAVILTKLPRAPRSSRRREVAVQVKGRCDGCA